jgi:CO/xanthine dehydrogenase FAD-binding subunit
MVDAATQLLQRMSPTLSLADAKAQATEVIALWEHKKTQPQALIDIEGMGSTQRIISFLWNAALSGDGQKVIR